MRFLGREYDYFDAFELINESNHYSEIFDEFINEVADNINHYVNHEQYTGWYYNMRDYNVNKNKEGVKLNLMVEPLVNTKELGYINPDRFPEITIHLSDKLLCNIRKLKAILLHELTHVIKLYIKNRNGLETNKETLSGESFKYQSEFDIRFGDKNKKNHIHIVLDNIFYIMTSNEQLATINETCKYLSSMSVDEVHKILKSYMEKGINDKMLMFETNGLMITRQAQVYNILNYLHEFHFLNSMLSIDEKFEDFALPFQLIIAYYLNKHGYIRKPKLRYITYDVVYSAIHSGRKYKVSKQIIDEIYHVYDCIDNIFESYKKKLYDAVFVIMEKNNMFLPIDEVYQIIPYNFIHLLEDNTIKY